MERLDRWIDGRGRDDWMLARIQHTGLVTGMRVITLAVVDASVRVEESGLIWVVHHVRFGVFRDLLQLFEKCGAQLHMRLIARDDARVTDRDKHVTRWLDETEVEVAKQAGVGL